MSARLLLIEDERALREALARSLARAGFAVHSAATAQDAWAHWQAQAVDAVLLDLSLPDEDGLDLLARARAAGLRTPVMILTARGTVGDRILGLNHGADDYLPKPFDLDELEARVKALLRRSASLPEAPFKPVSTPSSAGLDEKRPPGRRVLALLSYDFDSTCFYHAERRLEFTPRETRLMQALFERPGHAVPKERLLEFVFGVGEPVNDDAIEVVVYRLRKKLQGTGVSVATLRGLGYALQKDAA
jgi:two-component system, OmpR family, response regulator TctD